MFSSDRALMFIYNQVCISRALFSPSEKQEIGVCVTWQIRVALTRVGSSKPTHFDRTGFINNVHQFLLCQCKCISSTTGFHLFYPEFLRVMNKSWSCIHVCMHMYVDIFIHNSCHKYLFWSGTEVTDKSGGVLRHCIERINLVLDAADYFI